MDNYHQMMITITIDIGKKSNDVNKCMRNNFNENMRDNTTLNTMLMNMNPHLHQMFHHWHLNIGCAINAHQMLHARKVYVYVKIGTLAMVLNAPMVVHKDMSGTWINVMKSIPAY